MKSLDLRGAWLTPLLTRAALLTVTMLLGLLLAADEGESRPPTVRKLAAALDVEPRELLVGYLCTKSSIRRA